MDLFEHMVELSVGIHGIDGRGAPALSGTLNQSASGTLKTIPKNHTDATANKSNKSPTHRVRKPGGCFLVNPVKHGVCKQIETAKVGHRHFVIIWFCL